MEIIKNKNFKPKVENKKIKYLSCDYELHLKDLENLRLSYDVKGREVFAEFDTIFVNEIEYLIKINCIVGEFKSYHLNGFYEKADFKSHNITIGEDIKEYLFQKEKDFLETHNLNNIKESFIEM